MGERRRRRRRRKKRRRRRRWRRKRERETMYWLTSLKSPVVDFFQRWLEWPA